MSETPETAKAPVESLTFEEALRELEQVVTSLEKGDVELEKSIELYGRGAALRAHCQKKLEDAEARVAQITEGADGKVTAKPADFV